MKWKLLLLLAYGFCFAQTPLEWEKNYGGSGTDVAIKSIQTIDGGFIFVGRTNSNDHDVTDALGNYDIWIVKTDASGTLEWQKSIGGSDLDYGTDIIQNTDGSYVVSGYTESEDGDSEGNFPLSGSLFFLKLDNAGGILWKRFYGETESENYVYVIKAVPGGYIALGQHSSGNSTLYSEWFGETDLWLLRLDSAGNLIWEKSLGGNYVEIPISIIVLADGYAISGTTDSISGTVDGNHSGEYDIWIVKTDLDGDLIWQKCLGGTADDYAGEIVSDPNGNFYVSGFGDSSDGDITGQNGALDALIFKLDSNGNLLWQRSYGGTGFDAFAGLKILPDGNLLAVGFYGAQNYWYQGNLLADCLWAKIDPDGNLLLQNVYGGPGSDSAYDIALTSDGGFLSTGMSESSGGDISQNFGAGDFWAVKFSPESLSVTEDATNVFEIYPNPANDHIVISNCPTNSVLCISDLSGKVVFSSAYVLSIDISALASGMYILSASNDSSQHIKRFIKS